MKMSKIIVLSLLLFASLALAAAASTNLLTNPSFETGTGLADSWSVYAPVAGTPTYSLSTTQGIVDGTKSQKVVYNGVAGDTGGMINVYQGPVACQEGDHLIFSVYASGSATTCTPEMVIDGYTAGNDLVTEENTILTLTGIPTKYSVQYDVPATVDHVRVSIIIAGIGTTSGISAEFDNAELVKNSPVASFSTNQRPGTSHRIPFTVGFTDASLGNPTSYNWNFGDGQTSTSQNPTHTFTTRGTFTVVETVSTASGSSSAQRYIMATSTANLLQNQGFEYNTPIASPWDSEWSTVNDATYHIVPATGNDGGHFAQEMIYDGQPGETDDNKVEIFQSVYGMTPEENLTFSVYVNGTASGTVALIGIETFHGVGDPGFGGREWIAERDIPITITNTPTLYTVQYKMPAGTDSCAVYVHFHNVVESAHIDVFVDSASLVDNDAPPEAPIQETPQTTGNAANSSLPIILSAIALIGVLSLVIILTCAMKMFKTGSAEGVFQPITASIVVFILSVFLAVIISILGNI